MRQKHNRLANKTVLVTGASSGLGEQIAYEAAKQGAVVIVTARRAECLKDVSAKCHRLSQRESAYYVMNMEDFDSVEQTSTALKDAFGTVDVLVNCAGFGLFEPFLDFDMTAMERMFRVNVLGLMYLTQKIGIDMAERRHGHIINISSQAGKMATAKSTVYSATKFAVLGFSNALRLELKPLGVHVTTVNPGPIRTDFFQIADKSGTYLQAVDRFLLEPQPLARKIVSIMGTPKREVNAPFIMEAASKAYTLFPTIGDFLAQTIFNKK